VAAQAAIAVKRGDPMTVIVRGRGFTVQQAGEAMENGQIGDWIAIRTAKRGEPLRARIERPGLAEIPAD
jgi:flagella basal body P-ring formation protein FlgA